MRDCLPLGSFSPALSGACSPTQPAPVRVTVDSPAVDVMTDFAHVQAATIERSASLAVANGYIITRGVRSLFVASLKQAGRHHELVAETQSGGEVRIRGMFSVSQIVRQLGMPLQITELARKSAEIEQALVQAPRDQMWIEECR